MVWIVLRKFTLLTSFSFADVHNYFLLSIENELEQPSSPSVKKTEEKGIVVVHEVKCKLYVKVFSCGTLLPAR